MSKIIDFLTGVGKTDSGYTLEDILKWDSTKLERVHDYIQWLFPSDIPSQAQPQSPVLTKEDIIEIRKNDLIKLNLTKAFKRMVMFYTTTLAYEMPYVKWVTPRNHNYLRLTRILRCLAIAGLDKERKELLKTLKLVYDVYPTVIGETTLTYWQTLIKELRYDS